ncbi:MAG: hypothetical protein KGO05_13875 [Chloroflexota bacterium]|nr:hypothetical protein [Chloroflexota bacterium]
MSTASDVLTEERQASDDPPLSAQMVIRLVDERLAIRAEREKHMYLPTRIVGECLGDHLRRGARRWTDMPDEPPLGEEGGTAWTPDNLWLRDESGEVSTV